MLIKSNFNCFSVFCMLLIDSDMGKCVKYVKVKINNNQLLYSGF